MTKLTHKMTTTINLYYEDLSRCSALKIPSATITSISISSCKGQVPKDLRHFPNLKDLQIVDTHMDVLPLLSDSVETLCCETNNLFAIEKLPPNLVTLQIINNYIAKLPDFPASLRNAYLTGNRIRQLPPILNEGLENFVITYNLVKVLPEILPDSLIALRVIGNLVDRLPLKGGANLKILNCASNRIRELPPDFANAYAGLEDLNLLNNPIIKIDSLPQTIQQLRLEYTHMPLTTYRFPVPASLERVCCDIDWMQELAKIHDILPTIGYSQIPIISGKMMRTVDRFRELYFAVKLRDPLRRWLWDIRERQIREELSPANLAKYLEEHNPDDTLGGIDSATDAFFGI